MVFKVNKSIQEIKYWLDEFQQTVDKASGKQHLQFTAEIWRNDTDLPPSAEKDKVQMVVNDEFPFLDMKISWSPEGDLKYGLFRKKGNQLKYVGTISTPTPSTLRVIPSGLLNCLPISP